jgi:hypothetical protein
MFTLEESIMSDEIVFTSTSGEVSRNLVGSMLSSSDAVAVFTELTPSPQDRFKAGIHFSNSAKDGAMKTVSFPVLSTIANALVNILFAPEPVTDLTLAVVKVIKAKGFV